MSTPLGRDLGSHDGRETATIRDSRPALNRTICRDRRLQQAINVLLVVGPGTVDGYGIGVHHRIDDDHLNDRMVGRNCNSVQLGLGGGECRQKHFHVGEYERITPHRVQYAVDYCRRVPLHVDFRGLSRCREAEAG